MNDWFRDGIPLDPLIAPMVFFLNDHGVKTTNSCQGGYKHLEGRPSIMFQASSRQEIVRVYKLLKKYELDRSVEVGLITGFFGCHMASNKSPWYGKVAWLWGVSDGDVYKKIVYPAVLKLVKMDEAMIATSEYLKKWH